MKLWVTIATGIFVLLGLPLQSQTIDFEREVRPIFERSCSECHGSDKQKSGYRLDVREIAIGGGDSGEQAILPHDALGSPLFRYVSGEDEGMLMPPEESDSPQLTTAEVTTLKAWINQGPSWPDDYAGKIDTSPHWSLTPLVKPAVPGSETNPIDGFILARLAEKNLSPSPEADRRSLIRRINYDLTGLPPSLEEIESHASYEAMVDRLLASPRYGEHWARHWLDVVHYADTHGNDHDYARPNAWPYRDYVIGSLNEDKPYARFVQEQVAGDAIFPDDPQATVALGFLAAGPWDETLMVGIREDTIDHRMAQNLDRDDMVTTAMSTFTSITVHCARCHNHKFDPISQQEYYALQAVFAGVDHTDRHFDADSTLHTQRTRLLALKQAIERRAPAVMATLETPEVQHKIAALADLQVRRDAAWQALEVVSVASAAGAETTFAQLPDGSWFVSGASADKDTFIVTARTTAKDIRALRLEALPDDRLPGKGPGRYEPTGNLHLTEFRVHSQPSSGASAGATRVEFSRAMADYSDRGDVIANAIDGRDDTYWSVHPRYSEAHEAVFELKEPLEHGAGTTFIIRLEHHGMAGHQIGRFRLTVGSDSLNTADRAPLPAVLAEVLRKTSGQRTPEDRQKIALYVLATEVERELATLPPPQLVYAITNDFLAVGSFKPARTPRPIHLLTRGDVGNEAALISPAALACVPGLDATLAIADPSDESARRAALAKWLTDERNVLTWRSIVNRVWHYHFGRGLCDSPNDLGKMGAAPSHPELLDWLAVWFRDEAKGSLKALHRLILTSDTYRQGVHANAAASAIDADNRLLWRMTRRRLTAEELRDTLLKSSGQLDLTMGGPSVVQFVHRDKATFMPDGGAPAFVDYESFAPDAVENRRRAIYRFVFRTIPDPLMDALDAPDGSSLTPVRSVSTTALQAFALLNNPFVIRQCEVIGENVAPRGGDACRQLFRCLLQREPTADELARFTDYAGKHGLANACHLIVNSNEFLHVE